MFSLFPCYCPAQWVTCTSCIPHKTYHFHPCRMLTTQRFWRVWPVLRFGMLVMIWWTGYNIYVPLTTRASTGLQPAAKYTDVLLSSGKANDNRSRKDGQLNIQKPGVDRSFRQTSARLWKTLNYKVRAEIYCDDWTVIGSVLWLQKNGTFLEAGGHDGEFLSTTLWFEVNHGWTGILVEPQPKLYAKLQSKHRKVFSVQGCISTNASLFQVTCLFGGLLSKEVDIIIQPSLEFQTEFYISLANTSTNLGQGTMGQMIIPGKTEKILVDCYPLITILDAATIQDLDLLSLDVQGAEFDILRSIPWGLVNIEVPKPRTKFSNQAACRSSFIF